VYSISYYLDYTPFHKLHLKMTNSPYIHQLNTGEYIDRTLSKLSETNLSRKPSFLILREKGEDELSRSSCMISAVMTAINLLENDSVFTEDDVGEFYETALQLDASPTVDPYTGEDWPLGWRIITENGDMFHHTIAHWLKEKGYFGYSIEGFESVEELKTVIGPETKVVLSIDNRLLAETTEIDIKPGRHSLLITEINEKVSAFDPFRSDVPEEKEYAPEMLDEYIAKPVRGFAISKEELDFDELGFQQRKLAMPSV